MASLPKWRPRTTMIDLYVEREHTQWYWRLLATLSTSMILAGFIVFSGVFGGNANLRTSQGSVSAIAVVLLSLGYSLSVALWFLCTSLLFQLDVLFIPCLSSCILGLMNTIYALSIRPANPLWSTSSISCLTLSLVSMTVYTILALLTFHRIKSIRVRDITCPSRDSDSSNLLGEEERQKSQWMRLLSQKGIDRVSPSQSTFHIDLPENMKNENDAQDETYLLVPRNTFYEGRGWSSRSPSPATRPLEALQVFTDTILPGTETRGRGRAAIRPPVIVTTRPLTEVQREAEIRLSEVHPLQRDAYLKSLNASASIPRDATRGDERSRSREARRREIEREQVVPRIQRVQTDGWPQVNTLK